MATIEGDYQFPISISVEEDALDASYDLVVHGIPGKLMLPRLPDPRLVNNARSNDYRGPSPQSRILATLEPGPWATFGLTRSETWTAEVARVVVWFSLETEEIARLVTEHVTVIPEWHRHITERLFANESDETRLSRLVYRDIDEWFVRLSRWVSAYSGQDLDPGNPLRSSHTLAAGLRLLALDADGKEQDQIRLRSITLGGPRWLAATIDQWRASVRHASAKSLLPLEYDLLVQARAAMHRAQYRRAVIDAGASVEVAVANAIRSRLAATNEQRVIDALLEKATLGPLIQKGKRFGLVLPTRLVSDLVEVRNRAMHGAAVPSQQETQTALDTAESVLGSLSPLLT